MATLTYSDPIPVSEAALSDYLDFALDIAGRAGREALRWFRSEMMVRNKASAGQFDPVTEADRATETVLRDAVQRRFPEHGIHGEEFGFEPGNGLTWVLDPIDGTAAFMSGMLHWGVLIALFDGQRPILGVMHQPFTSEFFYGDGRAAHYRRGGVRLALRARRCPDPARAVLAVTHPDTLRDQEAPNSLRRLERMVRLCRFGGDCYNYAMVALGQVDLAADGGMGPHDAQPLTPIIQGAGGVITTAAGRDASMGGLVIAAGDPEVHARVLELVSE